MRQPLHRTRQPRAGQARRMRQLQRHIPEEGRRPIAGWVDKRRGRELPEAVIQIVDPAGK